MKTNVYSIFHKMFENGSWHDSLLGRVMILDSKVYLLEDHHQAMQDLFGGLDANGITDRVQKLQRNPYYSIKDIEHLGKLDTSKAKDLNISPQQEPIDFNNISWLYKLNGMDKYHTISFINGVFSIDGQKMDNKEVAFVINSLNNNQAVLRSTADLNKSVNQAAAQFQQLIKDESKPKHSPSAPQPNLDPEGALQHLETLVGQGHLHPDVANVLRQQVFTDPMTGLGNSYAYQQHSARAAKGPVLSIDGNNFKSINDTHGHSVGDQAIKGIGEAMKAAGSKVGRVKMHRKGGDEFTASFESPDDAHAFIRHLHDHLETIPPINGTHKLSVGIGMGPDFNTADKALNLSKIQKFKPEGIKKLPTGEIDSRNSAPAFGHHNTPSFAHSLMPGQEGPLNLK